MACDAVIVAGFGFRAAASAESLDDALSRACTGREVSVFATAEDKAASASFVSFAERHDLPVSAVDAAKLARQVTVTQSDAALRTRGINSMAEAAALAAAGSGARLIVARVVSGDGMATCALAEGRQS